MQSQEAVNAPRGEGFTVVPVIVIGRCWVGLGWVVWAVGCACASRLTVVVNTTRRCGVPPIYNMHKYIYIIMKTHDSVFFFTAAPGDAGAPAASRSPPRPRAGPHPVFLSLIRVLVLVPFRGWVETESNGGSLHTALLAYDIHHVPETPPAASAAAATHP